MAGQAERAVMQAFIPNTGPWRPYFGDHDVDAALDAAPATSRTSTAPED